MKILFVMPRFPYPLNSGNAVFSYHQLKNLSASHSVDILAFSREASPRFGGLESKCGEIEIVSRSRSASVLSALCALPSETPLQVAAYPHPELADALSNRLRRSKYDALVFELSVMGQFVPDHFDGAVLWILEDPTVLKVIRQGKTLPLLKRLLARQTIRRVTTYERTVARRVDRILLFNKSDVLAYEQYLGLKHLDWISYGVDGNYFSPAGEAREEGAIVMTGNMFHPPNVAGVQWFCERVFPLVLRKNPNASLWLVGSNPVQAVKRWSRKPRIHVTGSVTDMRVYLRRAKVAICPIELQVGVQTKVLEAMACGTPVVTTPAGNYGVCATPGVHLHVADSPELFADSVTRLLGGEQWHDFSVNARQFVLSQFSWKKNSLAFEQMIVDAVQKKRSSNM